MGLIFPKNYSELVEFTLPTKKIKKINKNPNVLPNYFVKETDKICLKKTSGARHIKKLEKKKKRKKKKKEKTNKSFESAPRNEWYGLECTNTPLKGAYSCRT